MMVKTRAGNNMSLNGHVLPLGERTCIMGIINVTPDSFSDGGSFLDPERALEKAKRMRDEGADIIDVGGESSRPGSERISAGEEIRRVMPVIEAITANIDLPVSIDTCKSQVAGKALEAGASVVNDITALRGDGKMARLVADHGAGVVLMHMRGAPDNMQEGPFYYDVLEEIGSFLEGSIDLAEDAGVDPDKIIIDPGIGFGKTVEHNLAILRGLRSFKDLGRPVMVGTSRKSFLGTITGKDVDGRLFGTAASCALAIFNGADIIRVHDVEQMRDVARVADALREQ